MASMVAENWECVDGRDGSEKFELSQTNHNLLMSLLDETQIDDCDDERLRKVIRSLEVEINSDGHDYGFDNTILWESELMDCQSSNDESDGHDCSIQHGDLDLHWMDMETMPTSPSGGMGSWYMDHHGQGMVSGVTDQFGWAKNYYSVNPFEEQDYGSLWHETNVTVIE
ncbi:hypothetical protein DH2020_011703 [Rehmannia glutinosa]|uniref:Uncharacterized protein n=1 Tax=Rehmannia glutinosa TaxID=99300 RepID=A0ABR0XE20_REHGL